MRVAFLDKTLKKFGRVGKRNATIPNPVLMPTFEVLAGVPQQQRTRSHEFSSGTGAVLKTSLHYDRDSDISMLFFKGAISRTCTADYVSRDPAFSPRQYLPGRCTLLSAGFDVDRNFPQELPPRERYNTHREPTLFSLK
ncbi:MAG TPA: hypothetical protein VL156_04205 [Terriglobales bacterium]|nr:hypothetical protein [Terriglobales bacterium]